MKNVTIFSLLLICLFSCKQEGTGFRTQEAAMSPIEISGENKVSKDALDAPSCDDIYQIFDTYSLERNTKFIGEKIKVALIKKLIERVTGKLGGVFISIGNPRTANPPQKSIFKKAVYDYFTEIQNDNPDLERIKSHIALMKISAKGARIEKDFGDGTECYDKMDEGIKLIEKDLNDYEKEINTLK